MLLVLEKEIIVIPSSSLTSSSKSLTPDTPTVQVSILPVTQLKPKRAFQKQDAGHTEYGASNKVELPLLLTIENNEDIIKYLETFLPKTYRLAKTHNGQQGIDKAFEIIPDLIISDVRMPQKNGFEVCSVLKNNERTSHIPIVLLTAKADLDPKIEGFKKGADAYITKPFSPQELLVRLQKLTELRSRLEQYYLSLATLD